MTARIFIDGQAGTTGLDIARRLAALPQVSLVSLPEADRKSEIARLTALRDADLAILCLPDAAAKESVKLAGILGAEAPRFLDASSAHRTTPGWVYGFAEMQAGQNRAIAAARRVANPGCYATGAVALLRPLVAAGLLAPNTLLSIHATSGYSGGGHNMIEDHEAHEGPAFELYGLNLDHKHVPEIMAHGGLTRRPIFVPSVAHTRQGMLVCIPLHLDMLLPGANCQRVTDAIADHYGETGPVRWVMPDGDGRLELEALAGTDEMELSMYGNGKLAQMVLVARLDNLGKGAAGAAVQNVRLMLGL